MKSVSSTFNERLSGQCTTLAWCWRIERTDGLVQGFTDHDRDVFIDGERYEAQAAVSGSEIAASIGLSRDSAELTGGLRSDSISDSDLQRGLYDHAVVKLFLVDWAASEQFLLYRTARLSEVRTTESGFVATLAGLSAELSLAVGRSFLAVCDASLGDARCGVNLLPSVHSFTATVTAGPVGARIPFEAEGDVPSDWLGNGHCEWTGGGNSGRVHDIRAQSGAGHFVSIELWRAPPFAVAPGDHATLFVGCDKTLETCRSRFANVKRFRGYPFMPGNDFVTSYPNRSDASLRKTKA